MSRKKHDMPEWFPFAIGAAAFVAIVAGARSHWRLSGDTPKLPPPPAPPGPPPPPPVAQAGVLQDWGL